MYSGIKWELIYNLQYVPAVFDSIRLKSRMYANTFSLKSIVIVKIVLYYRTCQYNKIHVTSQ